MRLTDRPQSQASKSAIQASSEPSRPAASTPHPPAQSWIEERTRVAVSRNVNVSGKLVFQEAVRIEGRFRGEVSSNELVVISEGGTVEGRLRTPRAVVLGELQGNVIGSRSVLLGPRSQVTGRIESESLTVCEGARLEADLVVRARESA